jgi:inosine/xanthosine triphosphatase
MNRNAIVAGTFDSLHVGHKALFEEALSTSRCITIGITSDSFAKGKKPYTVRPFAKRKAAIVRFLGARLPRVSFFELHDPYGSATCSKEHDAIVVSPETEPKAIEINKIRKRKGYKPLKIILVPTVFAQDCKKVSATRIMHNEIDSFGKRKRKMVFAIGSTNKDKLTGARLALLKFFKQFSLKPVKAKSRVPNQPFGEATLAGAVNRAIEAYGKGKADFGLGLESGLFTFRGTNYDITWCAVFDGQSSFLGSSMGLAMPIRLALEARKSTLGAAFVKLYGKKKGGVIDALSGGKLTRAQMCEQACACAMLSLKNSCLQERLKKHL